MSTLPLYPRGPDGRMFRFDGCPMCGDDVVCDGEQYGRAHWHCTGLVDPENNSQPLAACPFEYTDGDAR